jgi:hypothetical protein
VTTYSTDDAQDAIAGLVGTGVAVPLDDPILVADVIDGAQRAYADIRKENDELLERLRAIRQTVFPHLRDPGQRGELARDVEAEADPHPEPEVA